MVCNYLWMCKVDAEVYRVTFFDLVSRIDFFIFLTWIVEATLLFILLVQEQKKAARERMRGHLREENCRVALNNLQCTLTPKLKLGQLQ